MRQPWVVLILTAGVLAGCGGAGAKDDGAAGSGATGSGGSNGAGGSGGGDGAGRCAIQTRPVAAGAAACNTLAFGADWISPDPLYPDDAGVLLDGGAVEPPAGGAIVDGDYDLVGFRSSTFGMRRTRRSIRIFDGATYVEWLMDNDNVTPGGAVMSFRFDTSSQVSGTDLAMIAVTCGDNEFSRRFGYTATGNELALYQYDGSTGELQNIFSYRRSCSR
jgi:hypothetical protein